MFKRTSTIRYSRSLACFELGERGVLPKQLSDGKRRRSGEHLLMIPPGAALFRRLILPPVSRKDRDQVLQLAAESVLTESAENYYIDYWEIKRGLWGMAAVPRKLLDKYFTHLGNRGRASRGIVVPELVIEIQNGWVVWLSHDGLTLCEWREGLLVDWNVYSRSNGESAVKQMINYGHIESPGQQVIHDLDGGEHSFASSAHSLLKSVCKQEKTRVVSGILEKKNRSFSTLCGFKAYSEQINFRPASAFQKRMTAVAGLLLLASISSFFVVELKDLELQASLVEHQTSLFKIQSARSARVADRVRRLTAELREVGALQSKGVVKLLDDIMELMPATVKLRGDLHIDRRGLISLIGISQQEHDIGSLIRSLGKHPSVQKVRLQSVSRDVRQGQEQSSVQFRLQVMLETPLWVARGEAGRL